MSAARTGTMGPRASLPARLDSARTLASSRWFQAVAAGLAYGAFAVFLTWPLVLHLGSAVYGPVGDGTAAVSVNRELLEGGHFPFAPGTIEDFAAPDGLDIRWTLNLVTLPAFGSLYLLTALFGQLPALGLYMLLGFTLTGLAMFLLVRRVVGSAAVAFVAGWAYAFYPFMVIKAQGHPDFVHGWVFVVLLWRLIELVETPSGRNGLWAGLALVLMCAWTPYHILFAAVMAAAVGAVGLYFAWRRGMLRAMVTGLGVAAAVALVFLGGALALNQGASRSEVREHSPAEILAYSARVWEYVVPTAEHPIVGDSAGEYRASRQHGSNVSENSLYLGVTVLLLALVGFVASVRRPGPQRRIAVAAAAMAVAGFAFSAPPQVTILGVELSTPTHYLSDITTTWRVFSRFAMVVMLGVVMLAALGIHALARNRPPAVQLAVAALALAVIATDLWARPAQGVNQFEIAPAYKRLAALPPGIAAEYPLLPAAQSQFGDTFFQAWYDKPIVNGYLETSPEESRALRLSRLEDPDTPKGLKVLGVRYVLLRRDIVAAGLGDPGRPARTLKPLFRDDRITLYELDQPGRHVLVSPKDGFSITELGTAGLFQWMDEPEGTVELRGNCDPCTGVVRMTVGTFYRPRTVRISGPDGRPLAHARVRKSAELEFPVRFRRRLELRIESDPGPQSISETTGSQDPRSAGLSIGDASFTFDREGTR